MKKKPLILKPHHVEGEGPTGGDHWVTSVAAYPSSDLIASGKITKQLIQKQVYIDNKTKCIRQQNQVYIDNKTKCIRQQNQVYVTTIETSYTNLPKYLPQS